MSTIDADAGLLFDSIVVPRHDGAMLFALAISLLLHAAAIASWPALRVPQPQSKVLTVELQHPPTLRADRAKKIPAHKRLKKPPAPKVEERFDRQDVEPTPESTALPQPTPIVPPRTEDVAVVPRPEPTIQRRSEVDPALAPVPVQAQPHPLPEMQPVQQPRVERDPMLPEPARPEPMVERRAEVRPEPRLETRVEPRLQNTEPRPLVKVEQRVEPVATPRPEVTPQRQQLAVAPAPQQVDPGPAPKIEAPAPTAVPRVERRADVKPEMRAEPAIAARQRPVAEPTRAPVEPIVPQLLSERAPQPNVDARPQIKPDTAAQPTYVPRAQPREALTRNEMPPVVPMPEVMPQPNVERRARPRLAAPIEPAPDVRRPVRLEPAVEARAPGAIQATPSTVAPPEQKRPQMPPEISAPSVAAAPPTAPSVAAALPTPPSVAAALPTPPSVAAAMPTAPKRNRADQEEAIRRFALEISRQIERGISEQDYPRLARDRRWQGTTELVLRIHADGKLGGVSVGTSSGYQILDERAIDLINRLKLPSVPLEVQAQTFSVRIPVKFALRE